MAPEYGNAVVFVADNSLIDIDGGSVVARFRG
jgi:hypothetical protein